MKAQIKATNITFIYDEIIDAIKKYKVTKESVTNIYPKPTPQHRKVINELFELHTFNINTIAELFVFTQNFRSKSELQISYENDRMSKIFKEIIGVIKDVENGERGIVLKEYLRDNYLKF